MARQLTRSIAFACLLIAAAGCTQQTTKSEPTPVNLAETHRLAAESYKEQNWEESEKHYRILTQKSPVEAEPWFKLGNIYARTLRIDFAIGSYRETLVRDPQHIKAWHNMALIQLRQADKSYEELELLVKPGDPLHAKSVKIQQFIDELVN